MKVLYYSPHPNLPLYSPSGYGTHMREMIAAFEALGHDVHPLIMGGEEDAYKRSAPQSISGKAKEMLKQVLPAPVWATLRDLHLVRQDRSFQSILSAAIQEFAPDVVYERANYLQSSGVRVANAHGVPHILEVNSPYVEERSDLSGTRSALQPLANRAEREQLRSTNLAAVVSHTLATHLRRKHKLSSGGFTVVPNAIDPAKVSVREDNVRRLRAVYGLDESTGPVLGFVGSVFQWHRVDLLIKTLPFLTDIAPQARILVVGGGQHLAKLRKLSQQLGVAERVLLPGRVPHEEVFPHMALMDIAVAPSSHWYGSPVKIFEYAAMGLPVVAPNNGPVNEVVTHGEDALLVKPEVEELTTALRRLIEDPSLGRRLATSFKAKVLKRHTWEANARYVIDRITEQQAKRS